MPVDIAPATPRAPAPPPPTRTIGPRQRILALLGMGVVLLMAADLLFLAAAGVLFGTPLRYPLLLLQPLVPLAVAWTLGAQVGRRQWWEAALATLGAGVLYGAMRMVFTAVSLALFNGGDLGAFLHVLTLMVAGPVAAVLSLGTLTRYGAEAAVRLLLPVAIHLGLVGVGSYVGARRTELPNPRALSAGWRRTGVLAVIGPVLVLILGVGPFAAMAGARALLYGESGRPAVETPDAPRSSAMAARARAGGARSTEQLRSLLLRAMEEQEIHYAMNGYQYAASAEELGFVRTDETLEITWATDAGWAGRITENDGGRWCAVYFGEVPVEHRPPPGTDGPAANGQPVCPDD